MHPDQLRQNPYPPVTNNGNSATSVGDNPRPRIRNRPSSYSSTHAQIQAILWARFPDAAPSDIVLATNECAEVLENNDDDRQRVSHPIQSLLASSNGETLYDGFLRRKS